MKFLKTKKYRAGFTDHLLTYQCHDPDCVVMRDEDGNLHTIFYHKVDLWEQQEPVEVRVEKFMQDVRKYRLSYSSKTIQELLDKHNLELGDRA